MDETRVYGRVLSIQSHVVYGYVGNKAAVFPLELLGFQVDPIHTVQFSNHTGYLGGFRGKRLSSEEFDQLIAGLEANCLLQQVDYVLMGYIGDHDLLLHILEAVKKLKKPNLVFVCDPVMGDNGKLYVPSSLVPIYRDQVIMLADIITPNQFELSILSEKAVGSVTEAFQACRYLHEYRKVQNIVVTSGEYEDMDSFVILISSDFGNQKYIQTVEKIQGSFTGAGDLSSALILGWYVILKGDIVAACERAMASVHRTLVHTAAVQSPPTRWWELELIGSQLWLRNPPLGIVKTRAITLQDDNSSSQRNEKRNN
ncbi:hypothetical protein GAYE_SCF63G6650 [Galdieria yellowstonensis]|uniref:pyridoxal kinase n=1 Tax=Galdieria yellowstonensis TaxID=3028027 RepID=A0AAV9IMQ5_9RHOD|nr:hypothetical protein GAYE_SCF63G6650 [Galdieria yellowstonensis]